MFNTSGTSKVEYGLLKRWLILIQMEPSCKCLKNSFNLLIGSTDSKHMLITDASEWQGDSKPEKYRISITNTLHGIRSEIDILASGTNVLSTKELFGTDEKVCIQDSFYCFECVSCGKEYKINRVYLANTQCILDHLYVKANTDEEKKVVEDMYQDLKMVMLNTQIGRLKTAQEIYTTLNKKINTIGCNECGC